MRACDQCYGWTFLLSSSLINERSANHIEVFCGSCFKKLFTEILLWSEPERKNTDFRKVTDTDPWKFQLP